MGQLPSILPMSKRLMATSAKGLQSLIPPLSVSRPDLYGRLERARCEIGARDLAKH